nr:exo-alpha-sialidase [uncultured Draconibacterium sp.]
MGIILKFWGTQVFIFLICFVLTSCTTGVQTSDTTFARIFNYPVLKGKVDNPLVRIEIDNDSSLQYFQGLQINWGETNTDYLKSIHIYSSGKDSLFSTNEELGMIESISTCSVLNGEKQLSKGNNYFWISCELADQIDIKDFIDISIDYVLLDGEKINVAKKTGPDKLRMGVAVRQHMQDGVHTYRIPGLATSNNGTLLAIYDVRRESGRDLQGHMDIGVSRSTDGGNTWEPMRIALDMGEWGDLPEKFNGVSDANILVDRNTGDIYIAGLWMHGVINSDGTWVNNLTEESKEWNHQWHNKGSQPGFGVKQTSQFLLTKSTDDGQSWSEPINLTRMCKKEEWWLWAPAPGHGITMEDGTLVFPTQGRDEQGQAFSNITYNEDGGTTWITSEIAYNNTTECMVVELSDGRLMLNMRDNRNRKNKGETNGRAIATTSDLGKTWTEHETSHGALIEPVCMASIHKHTYTAQNGQAKSILLFSNPNSKFNRHKQTIKVSFDDGQTWPEEYWIELDEGKGAGYSCLTSIDYNTIGILYEGSQAQMTFQAIDIKNILQ